MAGEDFDCPAFSVSYNIMGLATVTYSIIHNSTSNANIVDSIRAGGQTFSGYVTNIATSRLPGTTWYETSVTLITTTN